MQDERIIGQYIGKEKGPLLIAFGSMHGNEPAGKTALATMFEMLDKEPLKNPDFQFRGQLLGLIGNLRATNAQQRFIDRDLNRHWTVENVQRVKAAAIESLSAEDAELRENIALIEQIIAEYQPEQIVVLDMHTTTAFGGIFTIATDDEKSVDIGIQLHAPVITGMLRGLKGTSLHYFCTQNLGVPTTAICFESGQHNEPLSVNRAIAALTNCMRTIGCVDASHIENRHDALLVEYSKGLPQVSELLMVHSIQAGDDFKMNPGYKNFQTVRQGEVLARDRHGDITAVADGAILMPLYQQQGEDGFFLVQPLDHNTAK
ncbi:MAG: succinylglutamate desuccinylase/aspartoacylase family protein [Bacteroidota bacterium]